MTKQRGGRRPGAGRKPSKKTQMIADAIMESIKEGKRLPHDILLSAARGEMFTQRRLVITYYGRGPKRGQEKSREWVEEEYWPSAQEQMDAAKAAAPYFAPKLAMQTVKADDDTAATLSAVLKDLSSLLPNG